MMITTKKINESHVDTDDGSPVAQRGSLMSAVTLSASGGKR